MITEILDASGDGLGNTLDGPWYLDVDSAGSVFVTGGLSNNVLRVSPVGTVVEIIDQSGDGLGNALREPWGITRDATGAVYVTGALSHNVFRITPPEYLELCNGDGGNQLGCTDCPCLNNAAPGTAGGCVNSTGSSAHLVASGDASSSLPPAIASDLRFSLEGAPPSSFCVLRSATAVAAISSTSPCFGLATGVQEPGLDGLRCVASNAIRHGGRLTDASGRVGLAGNPWGGEGAPPAGIAAAGGGALSGQTRYFQVIYREDPLVVCMRGLGTSQAVEVTFTP